MILVYNREKEDYSVLLNNYYIGRPSILGNPYTHLDVEKTKAMYKKHLKRQKGIVKLPF